MIGVCNKYYYFLLCIAMTSPAQAVLVKGELHGLIDEYAETSGEGNTVFGLDGPDLLGQPFKIDFSYRTELAPRVNYMQSAYDSRSCYESIDPTLDWLNLSITVNSITHLIDANRRYADIYNSNSEPSSFDRFQLAV